ncbi:MAG: glycosyltransferase [Gammaproteobacteria bacterium]
MMDGVENAGEEHPVDLSFLFIHYARSDLLQIAVTSLRKAIQETNLEAANCEFVIADDHSPEPHASHIRQLSVDKLVESKRNKGMGHNTNQGIAACVGKYIVQVQDDWRFMGTPSIFGQAVRVFESDPEIGLLLLIQPSSGQSLGFEQRLLSDGTAYFVFQNDAIPAYRKGSSRPYSDRPHIKRKLFCDEVGPYLEKASMPWVELEFQRRVANQSRWKVGHLPSESCIFEHLGENRSFNPIYKRARRLSYLSRIPVLGNFLEQIRPSIRRLLDMIRPSRKIRD